MRGAAPGAGRTLQARLEQQPLVLRLLQRAQRDFVKLRQQLALVAAGHVVQDGVDHLLALVARHGGRLHVAQQPPVAVQHLGRVVQLEVQLHQLLQRLETPGGGEGARGRCQMTEQWNGRLEGLTTLQAPSPARARS